MATITTTLAAGSVTSPYYFDVRITKQLCNKTPNAPVFAPTFSLVSYNLVGTILSSAGEVTGYEYQAIVNVSGVATYTPCGSCCAKSQTIVQQFVVPFYSTTGSISVTISSGTPTNTLVTGSGCNTCCSNIFMCDVPLNLSVTPNT